MCQKIGIKFVRQVDCRCNNPKGALEAWLPIKQKRIIGDGNCFFRSLSFIICGDESSHDIMRGLIVSHMIGTLHSTLKHIYNDETLGNKRLGDWSTDAEVFGAASFLNVSIHVYSAHLKLWQTFSTAVHSEINLYIILECGHFEPVLSLM